MGPADVGWKLQMLLLLLAAASSSRKSVFVFPKLKRRRFIGQIRVSVVVGFPLLCAGLGHAHFLPAYAVPQPTWRGGGGRAGPAL